MTSYKNPVCRGSYALGTACGICERCEETKELGKQKKDTGYKKLQRERDEYFTKWGEYMKRANVAEERIKQLEGLLGECEAELIHWRMIGDEILKELNNPDMQMYPVHKNEFVHTQIKKLKAAKEGK